MQQRKNIGIRLNDLRMNTKQGIRFAADNRFSAVEVAADGQEINPQELSNTGRTHLARLVGGQGLNFSSISLDSLGGGISDPSQVDRIVAQVDSSMKLAADMGVPVLSHDVGELFDLSDSQQGCAREALTELASRADRIGTIYAIRSRACDPDTVDQLVSMVGSSSVKISLDPGSLLMAGFNPIDAMTTYGEQVVLAYVRDATRGTPDRAGQEIALGGGQLDLNSYLAALAACGPSGPKILRREYTNDPCRALVADREVLDNRLVL